MTTYHSRMMNIARQGAGRVDVFDFDSFESGHHHVHKAARHAAAEIANEADAEIARLQAQAREDAQRRIELAAAIDCKDKQIDRLQAQLSESRQQTDALFNTGMQYCDKIDALKAQVDALAGALAGALDHATKLNSFREFNDYIPTMRAALAASGR